MPWPCCSSVHSESLHLQGVPLCLITPSIFHSLHTICVSLTAPFSPGRAQQDRGESPTCETCGPGSTCLGEWHGDAYKPKRNLVDPVCTWSTEDWPSVLGNDGMEGTVCGLFKVDLGTAPPALPLRSMGLCRGTDLEGTGSGCPIVMV